METWAIVLICIGVVLVLVIIAFLVYIYFLRKKKRDSVAGPLINKNSSEEKELHNQDKDENQ